MARQRLLIRRLTWYGTPRAAGHGNGVSKIALALAAAVFAFGGCSSPRMGDRDASLPGACQFMECVCAADDAAFWQEAETKPIVWLENGHASCPAGFGLKRVIKK